MSVARPKGSPTKREIATEIWASVLSLTMSQRNRLFRIVSELKLTPGDLRAFHSLDAEVPQPMRALAQTWECDASNATWIVDRLEERGFVERRAVPGDRRVKAIALTPAGAATKARLFEQLNEPPPEVLALDRATLTEIRDALAKMPASLLKAGPHGREGGT